MSFSFENLIKRNVRLSEHSSYFIGGEADYFALPSTFDELFLLFDFSKKYSIPFSLFGLGANILFPDNPGKGRLFISLKNLLDMRIDGPRVTFSAGVPLSYLAVCGSLSGTDGLDFTYLLPGTVGAGIYMNARYGEREVSGAVSAVIYTDLDENSFSIRRIESSGCGFGHKKSLFQGKNWAILGAEFEIPEISAYTGAVNMKIFERMKRKAAKFSSLKNYYSFFHSETGDFKGFRRKTAIREIEIYRKRRMHFRYPSCGSVFKNDRAFGAPAGAVIESLGLKGMKHGGAMISPHHCNMIINYNKARAADVVYLVEYISDRIYKKYGILPEREVVIL